MLLMRSINIYTCISYKYGYTHETSSPWKAYPCTSPEELCNLPFQHVWLMETGADKKDCVDECGFIKIKEVMPYSFVGRS